MSIVKVTQVQRTYEQGSHKVYALRGVDLSIEKGEFTVLMGSSGSGKTTLLNIIGGLDKADEGSIEIDGQRLETLSSGQLSDLRLQKLGFVFQAYNLIPVLSAYENAEFVLLLQGMANSERKQRVMKILDAVGLRGMEHRKPSELSGGQQQRVAVARAIAGEPTLVLADEPTANLDSKTSNSLIALMKDLNEKQNITFLFATHDPKVMAAAKRVVSMEDGLIISDERK
jgi:putative ABC transport system ATP-binding protein